jgi:hypothetical protein
MVYAIIEQLFPGAGAVYSQYAKTGKKMAPGREKLVLRSGAFFG